MKQVIKEFNKDLTKSKMENENRVLSDFSVTKTYLEPGAIMWIVFQITKSSRDKESPFTIVSDDKKASQVSREVLLI